MTNDQKNLLLTIIFQIKNEMDGGNNMRFENEKLKDHYDKLKELYKTIESNVFTNNEISFDTYLNYIEIVVRNLEFLRNSTVSKMPHEMVYCLQKALSQWRQGLISKDSQDDYKYPESSIITVSLSDSYNNYSYLDDDDKLGYGAFLEISNGLDIKFPIIPVGLILPLSRSNDYLANVTLYHELGHYVEKRLKFAESYYKSYYKSISLSIKEKYFHTSEDHRQVTFYLKEYFCDLFATQYVSNCFSDFLSLSTKDKNQYEFKNNHPSTKIRCELMNDFLNNKENEFINMIQDAIKETTELNGYKMEFSKRYDETKIASLRNDLINLIPAEIENVNDLSNIFIAGWEVWYDEQYKTQIKETNKMGKELEPLQLYHILNNLIEKSIGNFMVLEKWKQNQ